MSAVGAGNIHEVDFCGLIASAANTLFAERRDAHVFYEARVEGLGEEDRRKRKDLRFYDADNRLVLCGEVKLPGTRDGQSPYDTDLVWDAARKADDANVQYFFTWNVNTFVLWDRSQWDKPFLERRVREWRLGLKLAGPADVARPESLEHIRTKFLPDLFRDLTDIVTGRRRDWGMPPDEVFLRSLESRLEWPVRVAHDYMFRQAGVDRAFGHRLEQWMADQEWTFVRNDPDLWSVALDTAARSVAYVWTNRIIFYKALRSRFADLPRLDLPANADNSLRAQRHFRELFARAVERSGDYETLLMPDDRDWASGLVFEGEGALAAWRAFLRGIESVDFREVRSDIVGRIFQKLISPEERHKYGQHFTGDDPVDLINAFCVRRAEDSVLDPACGSGSFLVRAYYRKKAFAPGRSHSDLLSELFGCDISAYPAHLATLNLAAREINDEANYPRVLRRDFFHVEDSREFGQFPDASTHEPTGIRLPDLDAIVGNPPYVRQEKVAKPDKDHMAALVARAWNGGGPKLTGRSDLHCYFWLAAARFLKPEGMFGFLTSSSWLDVEYGFALQAWILTHFQIVAIMESAAEPWFADARVKTCITILRRCDNPARRAANLVHFVRFNQPLSAIIGERGEDERREAERLRAVERLRKRIADAKQDIEDANLRIIVKKQDDLWRDGVKAGAILTTSQASTEEDEDEEGEAAAAVLGGGAYRAGKWGRYVRAPDVYFRVMSKYGGRFIPLGELVDIRFGVKSGCDAFFMPWDVTAEVLRNHPTDKEFRDRTGVRRKEVESGKLKIIQDGVGVVHPIEVKYVAPEVHSLMSVDRPVVRASDLDRVVVLVPDKLSAIKGTWAYRYIKYGETAEFQSRKSGSVPIPKRPTCAARDPWYDLTGLVKPGFAFWPMAQQYRHIIPTNPQNLICNHNLFDLASDNLNKRGKECLAAILNCTMIGLFKTFYGRYAGTEGNLKTEVIDVNLIEVPDPRNIPSPLAKRLCDAFREMCKRDIGRLVEEQLMDCHSPERARRIAEGPVVLSDELQQPDRRELDDAVLEIIGIADADERQVFLDELYRETALHFRAIRVVEIQKMEQRSTGTPKRFTPQELAADAWDALELEELTPLAEWIGKTGQGAHEFDLPEGPATLSESMFDARGTVYFGKDQTLHLEFANPAQAELATHISNTGVSGRVLLPDDPAQCIKLLAASEKRLVRAREQMAEIAAKRTGSDELAAQVASILMRWFAIGRKVTSSAG